MLWLLQSGVGTLSYDPDDLGRVCGHGWHDNTTLPERRRAGSSVSTLLVAAITCVCTDCEGMCVCVSRVHLDITVRTKPVQLVEQLQHGSLHFSVTLLLTGKPLTKGEELQRGGGVV